MRRPTTLELMLLATIGLWSLNLTVSRYILTHGLQPLAYGSVRYVLAPLVFCAITLVAERSLRVAPRDLVLLLGAALVLYVNQVAFVYALHESTASVLALLLGATPIFAAIAGVLLRTETLPRRFWAGALLSFAGVALVALGAGDEVSGSLVGVLLGVLAAASWAAYSMLITPLMRRYSASRISTIVLAATCVPLTLTALPQLWRPGLEPRLGGLGARRVRHARASRRDERDVVPLARQDRPGARDARREPPAVRRGGDRRRPPLGGARAARARRAAC